MGYGYGRNGALACDDCGDTGNVRKRRCPAKVTADSGRTPGGHRPVMDYCPAPALCQTCLTKRGGNTTMHRNAGCFEAAAKCQAEYDATQVRLDAGELQLHAGYGDWDSRVPEGMTGALFGNGTREAFYVMPKAYYGGSGEPGKFLGDYDPALLHLVSDTAA